MIAASHLFCMQFTLNKQKIIAKLKNLFYCRIDASELGYHPWLWIHPGRAVSNWQTITPRVGVNLDFWNYNKNNFTKSLQITQWFAQLFNPATPPNSQVRQSKNVKNFNLICFACVRVWNNPSYVILLTFVV